MDVLRIALATIRFPASPDHAVELAGQAIARTAQERARIVCFPECFLPGLRGVGRTIPSPDPEFLERAWQRVAAEAAKAGVTVILGTERIVDGRLRASALVVNHDGSIAGFQDKVQLDPTEDDIYTPGSDRRLFEADGVVFGISICHEGWRYPETVRWSAMRGAQIVFHPNFSEADAGSYRPERFADPANTFHEKAALCRAAENTCYFATVNYASAGAPTASAVIAPDGTLLTYQPYGQEGLLVADLDLEAATCLLARRYRPA